MRRTAATSAHRGHPRDLPPSSPNCLRIYLDLLGFTFNMFLLHVTGISIRLLVLALDHWFSISPLALVVVLLLVLGNVSISIGVGIRLLAISIRKY